MAGETILIVEDNDKNLKLARDILTFNGFRTLEARTAEEGIATARSSHPDLILMDIQLAETDGVTALRLLKASPDTATIPVIALTAFAMRQDRERFLSAGFDGYIVKPISVKEFPAEVRRYCEKPDK